MPHFVSPAEEAAINWLTVEPFPDSQARLKESDDGKSCLVALMAASPANAELPAGWEIYGNTTNSIVIYRSPQNLEATASEWARIAEENDWEIEVLYDSK